MMKAITQNQSRKAKWTMLHLTIRKEPGELPTLQALEFEYEGPLRMST
jgi:hypothetical protein